MLIWMHAKKKTLVGSQTFFNRLRRSLTNYSNKSFTITVLNRLFLDICFMYAEAPAARAARSSRDGTGPWPTGPAPGSRQSSLVSSKCSHNEGRNGGSSERRSGVGLSRQYTGHSVRARPRGLCCRELPMSGGLWWEKVVSSRLLSGGLTNWASRSDQESSIYVYHNAPESSDWIGLA